MRSSEDARRMAASLDRLERQHRRLRLAFAATLIGVTATALVGFAAVQDQTVWARQFILVDSDGNKRGELSTDEEGAPLLEFFDVSGRARTQIGTTRNGNGLLRFRSRGGTTRYLALFDGTGVVTTIFDADGTRIAELGADDEGRPRIALNDGESGEPRLVLSLDERGPSVGLYDSDGTPAVTIDTHKGSAGGAR